MGVSVEVGLLSFQLRNDADGALWLANDYKKINTLLKRNGLPSHREPTNIKSWSAPLFGFSDLHTLRRIAAYIDTGSALPAPGNEDSFNDRILTAYSRQSVNQGARFFDALRRGRPEKKGSTNSNLFPFSRKFDHLILHSDSDGYYLPQDFRDVIPIPSDIDLPGQWIGSAKRLQDECSRLARALEIPKGLSENSEAFNAAQRDQGKGKTLWEKYRVESYTCLVLLKACEISLATGSAIKFA